MVAMMMTRDHMCRCPTITWLTGMRSSRSLGRGALGRWSRPTITKSTSTWP
uniref:Alternative protein DYRK2 n=1 Tax=Homo sapiens TaxID=9606 RepID=L8ECA4_HUMAN|nr:alternative protein DYRK2 [Homo sapiens]